MCDNCDNNDNNNNSNNDSNDDSNDDSNNDLHCNNTSDITFNPMNSQLCNVPYNFTVGQYREVPNIGLLEYHADVHLTGKYNNCMCFIHLPLSIFTASYSNAAANYNYQLPTQEDTAETNAITFCDFPHLKPITVTNTYDCFNPNITSIHFNSILTFTNINCPNKKTKIVYLGNYVPNKFSVTDSSEQLSGLTTCCSSILQTTINNNITCIKVKGNIAQPILHLNQIKTVPLEFNTNIYLLLLNKSVQQQAFAMSTDNNGYLVLNYYFQEGNIIIGSILLDGIYLIN
jgi:hypothetical protein